MHINIAHIRKAKNKDIAMMAFAIFLSERGLCYEDMKVGFDAMSARLAEPDDQVFMVNGKRISFVRNPELFNPQAHEYFNWDRSIDLGEGASVPLARVADFMYNDPPECMSFDDQMAEFVRDIDSNLKTFAKQLGSHDIF